MNNEDKFDYSYSAPTEYERREIEDIRKQYLPSEKADDKLTRLRNLDRRVKRLPTVCALVAGVSGTLIAGLGMTMFMEWGISVWGVIVGVAGIAVAAVAYPVYKALLNRNTRKYGKEIIELSNQLLNEDTERK